MADKYFPSIIGEMDRLWYRQVILFSQPTTIVSVSPKPVLISESPSSSSSILSLQDEETSTDESPCSEKQVSSESISLPLQDGSIDDKEERLERVKNNHLGNKIRSHSSSPSSTQNGYRKSKKPSKLEKSMSCRTLGELELDEVKGFMDLGFIFKKEYINPRIISVVPGLQRLCSQQQIDVTENEVEAEAEEEEDEEDKEEKRDVMRPYLSEAWLIKRPDSPLLNLKIPKPCSASNMKKHLRFWAKTVASEIQQE